MRKRKGLGKDGYTSQQQVRGIDRIWSISKHYSKYFIGQKSGSLLICKPLAWNHDAGRFLSTSVSITSVYGFFRENILSSKKRLARCSSWKWNSLTKDRQKRGVCIVSRWDIDSSTGAGTIDLVKSGSRGLCRVGWASKTNIKAKDGCATTGCSRFLKVVADSAGGGGGKLHLHANAIREAGFIDKRHRLLEIRIGIIHYRHTG